MQPVVPPVPISINRQTGSDCSLGRLAPKPRAHQHYVEKQCRVSLSHLTRIRIGQRIHEWGIRVALLEISGVSSIARALTTHIRKAILASPLVKICLETGSWSSCPDDSSAPKDCNIFKGPSKMTLSSELRGLSFDNEGETEWDMGYGSTLTRTDALSLR